MEHLVRPEQTVDHEFEIEPEVLLSVLRSQPVVEVESIDVGDNLPGHETVPSPRKRLAPKRNDPLRKRGPADQRANPWRGMKDTIPIVVADRTA